MVSLHVILCMLCMYYIIPFQFLMTGLWSDWFVIVLLLFSHGMSYPIAGNVKTHKAKGYNVDHPIVVMQFVFPFTNLTEQSYL